MSKFTKVSSTANALRTLVGLAEAHFALAPLLGEARVTLDAPSGIEVHVQMTEADLIVWCAVNGVTLPPSTLMEMDYTPWGGGFMTHRRLNVVVATVAEGGGRLVLVSVETVSTRPAPVVALTEQNDESVAVA